MTTKQKALVRELDATNIALLRAHDRLSRVFRDLSLGSPAATNVDKAIVPVTRAQERLARTIRTLLAVQTKVKTFEREAKRGSEGKPKIDEGR